MTRSSPLQTEYLRDGVPTIPFGPPDSPIDVPAVWRSVEAEYAGIRRAAVLMDQPHRGTLVITGSDALEFLNRMVTQELKGLPDWSGRRSFWLNRKGRIDADLRLTRVPAPIPGITAAPSLLVDADVFAAERTAQGLSPFLFAEDVQIENASDRLHRLALHGPAACAMLKARAPHVTGPDLASLAPGAACVVELDGAHVVVERQDSTGEIGLELTIPADKVGAFYTAVSVAPAGWHAFNIARVEAGEPIYSIDFGTTSLPHETGVLASRVSFTKGCYLGQEVVARMHSLGHPKQKLVGLLLNRPPNATLEETEALLPETGTPLVVPTDPTLPASPPAPIGAITSAVLSPMRSDAPIAFAMVKFQHAKDGALLKALAESGEVEGTVRENLRFLD